MTTHIPSLTLPRAIFEQPAASILLPIVLGSAVGFGVTSQKTSFMYKKLKQPPGNPPREIFGPVWTVLYGLMGYAAYRAWNTGMSSFDAKKVLLTKVNTLLPRRFGSC